MARHEIYKIEDRMDLILAQCHTAPGDFLEFLDDRLACLASDLKLSNQRYSLLAIEGRRHETAFFEKRRALYGPQERR